MKIHPIFLSLLNTEPTFLDNNRPPLEQFRKNRNEITRKRSITSFVQSGYCLEIGRNNGINAATWTEEREIHRNPRARVKRRPAKIDALGVGNIIE